VTLLDPHLEPEALSAALDGDDDPGARAHLDTCSVCRERLQSWATVLGALRFGAGADHLSDEDADRILATALASVPSASVPSATADPAVAGEGPVRARRGGPAPWRKLAVTAGVGVAAAGLVAVGVVGLRHLGSVSSASSSASPAGLPSASGDHQGVSPAGGSASGGAASGPMRSANPADVLRPVADLRDLRMELRSPAKRTVVASRRRSTSIPTLEPGRPGSCRDAAPRSASCASDRDRCLPSVASGGWTTTTTSPVPCS
jgi:hypothetical protein